MLVKRLCLIGIVFLEIGIIVWCVVALIRATHSRAVVQQYAVRLSPMDYKQVPTEHLANYYEILPGVIIEERPPWGGEAVFHKINNQGHNDPVDRMIFKQPGAYRVVALGDSFTFGQYVSGDKNYPSRLHAALSRHMMCGISPEMINLGVPGYDIQYAVERFVTHGRYYNPDLILWLLKDDDFDDIQEYTLLQKGIIENEASAAGKTAEYTKKKGIFFPEVMAEERLRAVYTPSQILSFQRSYLDAFMPAYQGKLIIFTFKSTKKEYKDIMASFARVRPNTWFADVLTYKDSRVWRFPDGHPTAVGYEQMAFDMMKYLTSLGIVPCSR